MLCWIFWVCLLFSCFALCSFFLWQQCQLASIVYLWCLVVVVLPAICFLGVEYIFIVPKNSIASWLKVVATVLSYVLLLWLFSCKNISYCLLMKCIFLNYFWYFQCCLLYWKCTVIVYLTNHVFCMSVWGGFGHGMANFWRLFRVVLGSFGEMIKALHQSNWYGIIIYVYSQGFLCPIHQKATSAFPYNEKLSKYTRYAIAITQSYTHSVEV